MSIPSEKKLLPNKNHVMSSPEDTAQRQKGTPYVGSWGLCRVDRSSVVRAAAEQTQRRHWQTLMSQPALPMTTEAPAWSVRRAWEVVEL